MITHRQSSFGHRRQRTTLVGVHATCIPKIVYDGANGYRTEGCVVYTISQCLIKISSDPHLATTREESAVRWWRDIPTRQHSMNMNVYIIKWSGSRERKNSGESKSILLVETIQREIF
jgi:hypothetical protein